MVMMDNDGKNNDYNVVTTMIVRITTTTVTTMMVRITTTMW